MKNQKRMIAVIAASGLALGSMPGVANAQSVEIGIGVSAVVGSVALGAALGSTGDVDSSGGTGSDQLTGCLLYTSPSPRDRQKSRMPSSA